MAKKKKHKAVYQKARQKRKAQKVLRRKHRAVREHNSADSQFVTMRSGATISHQDIRKSRQYPIYECQISNIWKENGLPYIWLSRKTPLHFVVGVYLVDIKCLGLKDTFVSACRTEKEYQEYKALIMEGFSGSFTLVDCPYDLANTIIYGGIAYGKQFGFEPHKDFQLSKYVLGNKTDQPEDIQFGGDDGKPFYISGPNDNVELILQKLTKAVGRDGFHFMLLGPGLEDDE